MVRSHCADVGDHERIRLSIGAPLGKLKDIS